MTTNTTTPEAIVWRGIRFEFDGVEGEWERYRSITLPWMISRDCSNFWQVTDLGEEVASGDSAEEALDDARSQVESIARAVGLIPDGWRPLFDTNGILQCEEGKTYLFALQVSTNGAPPEWHYFVDRVVWDEETEPDFANCEAGWAVDDCELFRPIEAPVDQLAGKGER